MSKKVMPPSTAARTMGSAWSSSSTQGRSLSFPKLIIPRQTRDTRRPVLPEIHVLHGHLHELDGATAPDAVVGGRP